MKVFTADGNVTTQPTNVPPTCAIASPPSSSVPAPSVSVGSGAGMKLMPWVPAYLVGVASALVFAVWKGF